MPYIGKSPVSGGFHKLDALTASATATYALTLGSAAYFPETANQLLVSLNGVIQAPQDSFTVSGSNLIFDTALTASDSIDFVVALGDVLGVQGVTDGAVTTAKIGNNAVTTAKIGNGAVTKAKIGTTELNLATIKDSTGTNTAMTIDSSGRVTMPYQPFALVDFGGGGYVNLSVGIVPFDNIVQNQGNHYNTSTYKFTCPVAGVYRVSAKFITSDDADTGHINLYKNNVRVLRSYTVYRGFSGDFTIFCSANDILHLDTDAPFVYQDTGTDTYSFASYYLLG